MFVLVVAISVVVAVVVGGCYCGSGGYAVVVVDAVDGDEREEIIYYFNV